MTVLVVGGGLGGLVAARAARERGDSVVVVEAGDRLGGSLHGADLAGLTVDVGAESIATRGGAALELIAELGLETAAPRAGGAWLQLESRAVPLPTGVLGIPNSPLADDVRAAIGWGASLRAYADAILPELKVGRSETLGSLVRRRMGATVLDTLVRPVVEGVYGVDPDDADADALIPGLTAALTRAGSLAGAVATVRANAPAGAAVVGVDGGVHLLARTLESDLRSRGADILLNTPVTAVVRDGGGWRLEHDGGVVEGEEVVIATGGEQARRLLAPHLDEESLAGWPVGRTTTVVALALDDRRLDAANRGTGVLVSRPGPGGAAALTHSSAKWPWLAARLPSGRHIVRVTYRGTPPGLTHDRVHEDAYRLLGLRRPAGAAVDRADAVWQQDPPRPLLDVAARTRVLLRRLDDVQGISVTGAWVAGTGIASIVEHAQNLMKR